MDFWLRSYYANMTGFKPNSRIFFPLHQRQIEKLYKDESIICQVACLPDDEDVILGFAVFGNDYTLHYVGVKETFKNLGVCKELLKSIFKDRAEITVSHWTKDIKHIQKLYKVNYNPYRFYQ
jgi:hypothetical protein